MPQRSVPIPGEILKMTVVGGLTFEELAILISVPLVVVLPSVFISQIPLTVTLGLVALGAIGVVIVVYQTPEGQSPVGWFPAYLDRKIKPTKRTIQPERDNTQYGQKEVEYLNVVHTAPMIEEENNKETIDIEQMRESIDLAEKLEREERNGHGVINRVISRVKR